MTRGNEKQVIEWLEENCGKVMLPHIGVLTHVETIGKVNDNRKKADVLLNGIPVSLKQVESSFLYNKGFRSDFFSLGVDIQWFDNQVKDIHYIDKIRNVSWQTAMDRPRFQSLLRILMMDMNLKQGISRHPAELILTHPSGTKHVIDICVYNFKEFFEIFANDWITFAFIRHWPGQEDKTESDRAYRILNKPKCQPWVFDGVSGNGLKNWAKNAPPPDKRQTCFTCSIAINSPVKRWEHLREFRLSLLNSGFFGVDSEKLERVTHEVKQHFGCLIYAQEDKRWMEVLKIANQIASTSL